MTLRTRISSLERAMPAAKVLTSVPSPLPKVIAAVTEHGGRREGESWAGALARLLNVSTTSLMSDLRGRADRNNGQKTVASHE